MASLPQHILNIRSEQITISKRAMLTTAACSVALLSPTSALSTSLYQPRLVSDLRSESLGSRRNALLSSIAPSLDNDAWLAALFEEEISISDPLESLSDRIMQASVKDAVKPTKRVQQSKGADVDPESLLQMQAQQRRQHTNLVTASAKLTAGKVHPLTKEYEYTLANAIQSGVSLHKLKTQYESTNLRAPSKKEWAALANIDTATLRKTVAEYRSAKQELVSSNMGLVHAISREFIRRPQYSSLTLDELIQEGSLGLIRAAELFDPIKGLRFSTYATIWIKGALQNQRLGEFVKMPYYEKKAWRNIRSAIHDIGKEGKTRDEITSQLIADKLGMKASKVDANIKRMTSVSNVLSLDYQYASSSRSGQREGSKRNELFLKDDVDLAENACLKADIVTALVSNLNDKEIQLIRLVYGLCDGKEHTIVDSAKILGMNKETCRLLHKSCLRKLREAKNMESLQEYLLTIS